MRKIKIAAADSGVSMTADLNDTETANKLWDTLPVSSPAQRWGMEAYFEVPVEHGEDDAKATVPSGAIAYWPSGKCFCIFFGQTPYSPVNVLGTLDGRPEEWDKVKAGETVTIEKAE